MGVEIKIERRERMCVGWDAGVEGKGGTGTRFFCAGLSG